MTKPIQIKNLTIGAGIPKICVPLTGTTREKICQEAEDAKKAAADLVEWRADFFEELMNPEACQNVLKRWQKFLVKHHCFLQSGQVRKAEILPFLWRITLPAI